MQILGCLSALVVLLSCLFCATAGQVGQKDIAAKVTCARIPDQSKHDCGALIPLTELIACSVVSMLGCILGSAEEHSPTP